MAFTFADRVQEVFTTTGTGTVSLGGPIAGYQAFSAQVANGGQCYYGATDGTNWEIGIGTYATSGNTLARTKVIASSNSNAAVNWSAGNKNIWLDFPAAMIQNGAPVGGSVKNFKSVVNSTTAATLTADEIVLEDANGNTQRIKSFNQGYATGTSGAGGLDTGAIASSTWYYEYAAYNPTTGNNTAFISLSATAPTLPSGYLFYKCTGEVRTDGSSHLIGKLQYGKRCRYVVGVNLSTLPSMASGASGAPGTPTWTAVAVANFVPPTAPFIDVCLTGLTNNSNGGGVAPNNSYGALGSNSAANPPLVMTDGYTNLATNSIMGGFILESSNIYYYSYGDTTLTCVGWETNLLGV